MAKGTRLPEETKRDIAERYSKIESPEELTELATRFGISEYTVREYASQYGKKRKRGGVRRKATVQPEKKPKENTRVSPFEAENSGLREEVQRLRNLLLDEILRNK